MLELTAQNAAEILHRRGHLPSMKDIRVRELSGGVSNAVFLIETPTDRFVVKQARGKLRVQADWQCSVERIWREVEVLQTYYKILGLGESYTPIVPKIFWTDRELYAYAMTAAAADSLTWKELLLAGTAPTGIAIIAGDTLAELHGLTWHQAAIAQDFRDRTYFAQLRLDPYYLAAADNYSALANPLGDLVDQTWREQHALVHGDFSPKNILVGREQSFFLIDFEVGHYGDPAFDVGFCLTHLVLKAIHLPARRALLLDSVHEFWEFYSATMRMKYGATLGNELPRLEHRTIQHLAGCLVARVHGKSPVDYLTPPEQLRAVQLAEKLFALGPAATWAETFALLQREI